MESKTVRKNKRGKDGVVCGPNATISEINANGRRRWRVLIREEQPGGGEGGLALHTLTG